jgi:DNA-binding MarR family transcriptional regulator
MNIDLSHFDTETADLMSEEGFVGLAGFRLAMRRFLSFSEAAVKSAGITSQQYQAMLAIRASEGQEVSMKALAQEMILKPNGAVQLVDRLEALRMVQRRSAKEDRRGVLISLTELGNRVIAVLAAEHSAELVRQRPLLVESLRRLKSIAG